MKARYLSLSEFAVVFNPSTHDGKNSTLETENE